MTDVDKMRKLMEAVAQFADTDWRKGIPVGLNSAHIAVMKLAAEKRLLSQNEMGRGVAKAARDLFRKGLFDISVKSGENFYHLSDNGRRVLDNINERDAGEIDEASKVNYDQWTTPPTKKLNRNHYAILKLMSDGKPRERSDMIRRATDMDPNPRSENDFAGWNKVDYDLYKHGLLAVVDILPGGKKVFKITKAGKALAKKLKACPDCLEEPGFAPDEANYLYCKTCKGTGVIGG